MQVQHFIFHHENSDFSLKVGMKFNPNQDDLLLNALSNTTVLLLCSWMCSSLMFANKTDVLLDIRPSSAALTTTAW